MARLGRGSMKADGLRTSGGSSATPSSEGAPGALSPGVSRWLDEVESVARIGSYSTDLVAGRWVSSKGLDTIFGIDADFDRSVEGWASLVHPADREAMLAYFTDEVLGLGRPFDRQYRVVSADTGQEHWVHGRGALEFDGSGRPVRMFGTIADITEARGAQEALIRSELRYAAIFEGTAEAVLIADVATARFRWVNAAACAMFGFERDELLRLGVADIHPPDALPRILEQFRATAEGRTTEGLSLPCLRKDGSTLLAHIRASRAVVEGIVCNIAFFTDVTELRSLQVDRQRLEAAVEQSTDAVIITDLDGRITYVNPAFERSSGYRREEAIGQNPRFLKGGLQSAAFYRAMWRRLARGRAWTGTLNDRRKDGTLFEAETTISPIRTRGGEISAYVAVKRDVSALRAAETSLAREFRERAQVAAALSRLQVGPSVEATAAEICDELLGLPGIDIAAIINFIGKRRAVPLASGGPDGVPFEAGRPLPAARAAYLYERATQGPWAERWRPRPEDGRYGERMAEIGVRAVAYAPIRHEDQLLGVVAAGTRDDGYAGHLIDHLPAVGEFAATASGLLGAQLERGRQHERVRQRVRRAMAEGGLRPFFQPIVDLGSSAVVGYEALSRFADGTPPDRMIAEAHSVGMGLELEIACIAAALEASKALPPGDWLSLNVSPDVLSGPSRLGDLLAGYSRRIVLEITEHAEVEEYAALRRIVAALGPTVSLAVDDVGAGFANLRHVVELAPRFIKLDISLVRGVHHDLARQAMIAGLSHFAQRIGCQVIAEGIEERDECELLRDVGVPFGQGYLFGSPKPLAAVTGSPPPAQPPPAARR